MVPADLERAERLDKALRAAADLAGHYGATVCYAAVAAETPGRTARTPNEFRRRLAESGDAQIEKHRRRATARTVSSHDPAADLDRRLADAVAETGADRVVMASHIPGGFDAIWPPMAAAWQPMPRFPSSSSADRRPHRGPTLPTSPRRAR